MFLCFLSFLFHSFVLFLTTRANIFAIWKRKIEDQRRHIHQLARRVCTFTIRQRVFYDAHIHTCMHEHEEQKVWKKKWSKKRTEKNELMGWKELPNFNYFQVNGTTVAVMSLTTLRLTSFSNFSRWHFTIIFTLTFYSMNVFLNLFFFMWFFRLGLTIFIQPLKSFTFNFEIKMSQLFCIINCIFLCIIVAFYYANSAMRSSWCKHHKHLSQ